MTWQKTLAENPGGKLFEAYVSVTGEKMTFQNKQPTFSANPLANRARRFATILTLLFARQNLTGKLATVNRGARHLSMGVRLSNPMQLDSALKLAEPLALATGANAVLAQRIEGVVCYQVELPQGFWEYYTRADLPRSQAVGLAEQRRPVDFILDPPHALVAGATGAGKSEALKSILLALMTSYTPAQLGIILIDPHNDYGEFAYAAHLAAPITSDPPDVSRVLAWANQELTRRKAENNREARTVVIAIDEADSVLFGTNLEIAKNISKQARKYRIHLILATQKPLHADLPGILDNLLNRFVGQLSDANTSARVTGHAGLQAHKLTPKGDFLHVTGPQVERFQVALATRQDFDRLPRAEVGPVVVESGDIAELPGVRQPGRPQLVLNPEWLAWYFYHNPDKISRAMAKMAGISRDSHVLHRDFARQFVAAYLKLRQEQKQLGA